MTKEEFFTRYTFDRTADRLGAGSFGTVYRAYDNVLDTWVALKISPVDGSGIRLSKEVELVISLREHPNVAGYLDCRTFDDVAGRFDVAVLRYYPEGSLADLLDRGEFPQDQADAVLAQILEGLRFLHANGIVHRDLKPGNILIARRPDGQIVPKITDFGISKQLSGADDTVTAAVTVSYASPEQLRGLPVSTNSDLWSFGVIAYRILTGRMPFSSGELDPNSMMGRAEIINLITSGQIPSDVDGLPRPWNRIVNACFVVDSGMRTSDESALLAMLGVRNMPSPSSMDSLTEAIHPAAPGTVSDEATEIIDTDVQPRRPKRNDSTVDLVLRMVIAAAVVVGVFMVFFISRHRDSAPKVDMEQTYRSVNVDAPSADEDVADIVPVESEEVVAVDSVSNYAPEYVPETVEADTIVPTTDEVADSASFFD